MKKKLADKIRSCGKSLDEILYTEIVDKFIEFKMNNSPTAKFKILTPSDAKSMKLIITFIYRNVLLESLEYLYDIIQPVIINNSISYLTISS